MILELTQGKVVLNQNHVEMMLSSEYKNAREAIDGLFVKADICMRVNPKSGQILKRFHQTYVSPLQANDIQGLLSFDSDSIHQRIKILSSKFKLNLNPGSNESLNWLKTIKNTSNLEIFRGKL
jgi:hypothetical protein